MTKPPVIQADKLAKSYGGTHAVRGISFAIEPGEIFGFLGPNGAGKTTTIRLIMGLARPTAGAVSVLGQDPFNAAPELRRHVGFVPADAFLYPRWTGGDHIRYVQRLRGLPADGHQLLREFALDPAVKVKNLSTGNRQKLSIILALLAKPDLLVMDEPTQGLDPILQNDIHQLLQRFQADGGTIFISSHDLREVEKICSRVGIIRAGELAEVASISHLRSRTMHHFSATTTEPLRLADFQLPGATVIDHADHRVSLRIKGPLAPFVRALAAYTVTDLEVTHSSLEEVLLEYYK